MSLLAETNQSKKKRKNEDLKLDILMSMYHKLSLSKLTEIALAYGVIQPKIKQSKSTKNN